MRIVEVLVPATVGGTSQVKKRIGSYPRVRVEGGGRAVVSQAGAVLLVETVRKAGLDQALGGADAVAASEGGARSGQDPAGCGSRGRVGRGLPRGCRLRFARHWPWTDVITNALARLEALPNPG
jgi:hypothetical protein